MLSRFFRVSKRPVLSARFKRIDVSGICKARLLSELFNNSKPIGLGYLDPDCNKKMTVLEAQFYLEKGQFRFDYLQERVMKIDLSSDSLFVDSYDRDNGQGAAENIVEQIKNASEFTEFRVGIPENDLEKNAASGLTEKAFSLAKIKIALPVLDDLSPSQKESVDHKDPLLSEKNHSFFDKNNMATEENTRANATLIEQANNGPYW